MKILSKFKLFVIKKAYTEGVYADTPTNRKLGRVGMSYFEYNSKQKEKEEDSIKEIKDNIQKELNKFGKNNDYVSISTSDGNILRFSINMSNATDESGFNECLVKDKDNKILKNFKNSHESGLLSSVAKYLKDNNINIVKDKDNEKIDIDIKKNNSIIANGIKKAKEDKIGTILLKTENNLLVYLSRKRESKWLRNFDSYTIRDSKRNVITQGKADKEEEVINKLKNYLVENKIQLKEG